MAHLAAADSPRRYTSRDLAILVPTKDRPDKVRDLLTSLAAQTAPVGRIIFIDGGASIEAVVGEFADRLPVERHACLPPGQIRQRNMGIGLLDARTPLAASLDDDIVLLPDAVERMIAFWNTVEPATAAVSFNIVNTPPEPNTWLRRLFGLAGPAPGRVLPSGNATSSCQARADARVEWVCGGATVWRADVLRDYPHRALPAKWAIAEDLVYSYPIGQALPLYLCASAQVRHEHVFDYATPRPHRFHGYTQTLWMLRFVESNPRLSRAAFLWMMTGSISGRLLSWLVGRGGEHREYALGQIAALRRGLGALARGEDLGDVIKADAERAV